MLYRIGRFPVIMVGIVIELIAGALCAGAVSIEMFLVARFLLAVGASGRWASGFVLCMINKNRLKPMTHIFC